jgi:N-methylhydantoinase A
VEAAFDMRYRGQAFELAVRGDSEPDPGALAERFAASHERRYGYRDPEGEMELVTVRVALVEPGPEPRLAAAPEGRLERSRREARFGGEGLDAEVLRGEPAAGVEASGPCIFELPEATLVLPPGWSAAVDEAGTIVADREPG